MWTNIYPSSLSLSFSLSFVSFTRYGWCGQSEVTFRLLTNGSNWRENMRHRSWIIIELFPHILFCSFFSKLSYCAIPWCSLCTPLSLSLFLPLVSVYFVSSNASPCIESFHHQTTKNKVFLSQFCSWKWLENVRKLNSDVAAVEKTFSAISSSSCMFTTKPCRLFFQGVSKIWIWLRLRLCSVRQMSWLDALSLSLSLSLSHSLSQHLFISMFAFCVGVIVKRNYTKRAQWNTFSWHL